MASFPTSPLPIHLVLRHTKPVSPLGPSCCLEAWTAAPLTCGWSDRGHYMLTTAHLLSLLVPESTSSFARGRASSADWKSDMRLFQAQPIEPFSGILHPFLYGLHWPDTENSTEHLALWEVQPPDGRSLHRHSAGCLLMRSICLGFAANQRQSYVKPLNFGTESVTAAGVTDQNQLMVLPVMPILAETSPPQGAFPDHPV